MYHPSDLGYEYDMRINVYFLQILYGYLAECFTFDKIFSSITRICTPLLRDAPHVSPCDSVLCVLRLGAADKGEVSLPTSQKPHSGR